MSRQRTTFIITLFAVLIVFAAATGWYLTTEEQVEGQPALNEAAAQMETYRSGPFLVGAAVDPEMPVVGNNRLTVRLQDTEGNPVTKAVIKAVAIMPSMGTMGAMYAPVDLQETGPGLYTGPFQLAMAGSWPLTLEIEKTGMGRTSISFDLGTSQRGLSLTTGGRRLVDNGGSSGGMDENMEGGMNGNMDGMLMDGANDMPTINLDNRRRQLIGVETGEVERRRLVRDIRAVGEVGYDETRVTDITLRFDAWIGELYADYVGKDVREGEVLFTVYGPELLAAQQEYLEIARRRQGQQDMLLAAIRKRLLLWGMNPRQIKELEGRGEPLDYVPVLAPQSGTIIEKNIVAGTAHKAGMTLLRIADLDKIWIDAKVYDSELPLIEAGMNATVSLPYLPDTRYQANVDYVYPYLQGMTRTGRIRLSLPNPAGLLKPGMYAEVSLQVDLGERLVVPESAVMFSGQVRVVFIDLGDGRLQPRYIETSQRNKDYIEVTAGLEPGESAVTSGNFLIDSETRLKTGIQQW